MSIEEIDTHFREEDGSINLRKMIAFSQGRELSLAQLEYVQDIEDIRLIKSRQLAAFITATIVRFDQ